MTVDIPTRVPEQQAPQDGRRPRRGGPQITLGRSRTVGKAPLVVGAQPRANLLPPEIVVKRQQLKTRRALRVGVFFVFLATVAGCIGIWGLASVSQVQLLAAQDRQAVLVDEQVAYQEVRDVQNTIQLLQAGQLVGGSTEINWQSYLTKLQLSLPAGVVLQSVTIESGTPMAAMSQTEAPLQGSRVASLNFTAISQTLPTIPDWLRELEKLPGFVDATPGNVKQQDGIYTAQVLMNINTEAFSMRFDPEHIAAAEAAAEAAAKSNGVVKSMVAVVETAPEGEAPVTEGDATEEGGQ